MYFITNVVFRGNVDYGYANYSVFDGAGVSGK